ncbi:MAG: ankyrin repeat domain-containing protein [Candidatus Hydrogenedentes bacterium]|nr:ankyrin repeat domain-containing protein [Candidatus Hydrogenedentota bacterium]
MVREMTILGLLALLLVSAGCTKAALPADPGLTGDLREMFSAAILKNDVATVEQLLAQQPLLASAPNPGTSYAPLHLAAQTKNSRIIQILLDNGADKYMQNDEGEYPYDVAVRNGASESLLELLK